MSIDKSSLSVIDLLPNHLHVCPIVAIDFSMGNLTFSSNGTSVHTPNVGRPNQYRDLLQMIGSETFSNEHYMPIFGYGAKTFPGSPRVADIFPLSMNMCNPLVPNQNPILASQYAKCLKVLRLDLPVKLSPLLKFLKELALSVRERAEGAFQRREKVVKYP